ncbi:hydroxymethylbutenyl pyrophosphate reductase [Melioribacter roseus P3M-2]|uniref:Hydroxymethylbutenyl pyrophosphate reductase n=1 Tax=Melioribacter roseus (strain DSM 23840 / JCM 17771 / VKM B-2668 / P3M-2) TaxID=1191523 RepID=I7A3I5_MELRP|nr:4-hydroxy-3-methylbut-2-enyl diphosphate reductase [Melioribacter roseus]AFN74441.1 hydroxymethylbutenyl pyrophosphate reductase [Melioribacter roseus P3M-2]
MKKFDIPDFYRSPIISAIKAYRKTADPLKKDFSPTRLEFGNITLLIARHFGFCYGVENAIEIAYKTVRSNPGKRIFLLSEMIHNPHVNEDLKSNGVNFIMDNHGNQFVPWDEITSDDIVIIPAFGTTVETENLLKSKNIDIVTYNTTCPFVEKVWNRSAALGGKGYTIVIHGKHYHEETRATFSHTSLNSPSVIVRDLKEARILSEFILGYKNEKEFYRFFEGKLTPHFKFPEDLERIGVVNQTTMLAEETEEIANLLKQTMLQKYGEENLKERFADTRDTLCYATNDNQSATYELTKQNADAAIVVGGYNSSNTSHLVEILSAKFPTYFISDPSKIISKEEILYFDIEQKKEATGKNFLPKDRPPVIAITSGASCPDSLVEAVIRKLLSFYDAEFTPDILSNYTRSVSEL